MAIRFPDEPNVGALLEQFRETEFATEVSRLITHADAEIDDGISDEEAEAELRQLRVQIEDGSLFPSARAIAIPEHLLSVGILALGARRPAPTAEQDAAAELRATPPPRVFKRPTRDGVAAVVVAAAAPVVSKTQASPANAPPPTPAVDNHEGRDSEHHDAFDEVNFAATDEDDIPFDFDRGNPAGPQDHHDAPF